MAENKADKQSDAAGKNTGQHGKRQEERRQRQAQALRANLKKRKSQIRQRDINDANDD